MPASTVDQQARDDVRDVRHELAGHVATTDIEFRNLRNSMDTNHTIVTDKVDANHKAVTEKVEEIRKAILWAGGLIVSIMLSVLGWAVLQQFNANESQKQDLQQQIELLRQGEAARALEQENQRLSAAAAESQSTSDSVR